MLLVKWLSLELSNESVSMILICNDTRTVFDGDTCVSGVVSGLEALLRALMDEMRSSIMIRTWENRNRAQRARQAVHVSGKTKNIVFVISVVLGAFLIYFTFGCCCCLASLFLTFLLLVSVFPLFCLFFHLPASLHTLPMNCFVMLEVCDTRTTRVLCLSLVRFGSVAAGNVKRKQRSKIGAGSSHTKKRRKTTEEGCCGTWKTKSRHRQ